MTDEEKKAQFSRRAVVGAMAVGAAAAGTSTGAAAQTSTSTNAPSGRVDMPDPRTRHARPPFKPQSQPFPALVSRMDPRPDHGEESYVGSGRLRGLRALITGGDSGVGRAAAIAYAREGADVTIAYLPDEEPDAREVLALIKAAGRRGFGFAVDIRTESACTRLIADAVAAMGGLDILVNNAGAQAFRERLEDLSSEQFDRTLKTNVYAPFWLTKAALPHLGVGSSIIMTASTQGVNPEPNVVDYALTKAANISFAKSVGKQLASRGIRVNAAAPGACWTPLIVQAGRPDAVYERFGANAALGRPAQPSEAATLFVQLADPQMTYAVAQFHANTGGTGQG